MRAKRAEKFTIYLIVLTLNNNKNFSVLTTLRIHKNITLTLRPGVNVCILYGHLWTRLLVLRKSNQNGKSVIVCFPFSGRNLPRIPHCKVILLRTSRSMRAFAGYSTQSQVHSLLSSTSSVETRDSYPWFHSAFRGFRHAAQGLHGILPLVPRGHP